MNSAKQTFGICSIQSLLRETGRYKGKIDGLFGTGCYTAFEAVTKEKVEHIKGYDAKTIFFNLQRALVRTGADVGKPDGIWGYKSQKAFEQIIAGYQREYSNFGYSYAWSAHREVTQSGIEKIEAWLIRHGKPASHTSYLLSCISYETGGTFYTHAENPISHALGLIQFMPSKLESWKVDPKEFANLSFDNQLTYVFKFFEEYNYIAKCNGLEDYYLSIFYPKATGSSPDLVIAKKGTKLYQQNARAFDKDGKGYYTVADIARPVVARYWMGMDPANRKKISLS